MTDLDTLDLKELIRNAVNDVFAAAFFMELAMRDDDMQGIEEGNRILGSVSFAGALMGNINIHVNENFAQLMTAALLGLAVEEINRQEVFDVIGELCNMVGGDLKSRLCGSGWPCKLSLSFIAFGSDFMFETRGWARKETLTVQYRGHTGRVEVCLKPGQ